MSQSIRIKVDAKGVLKALRKKGQKAKALDKPLRESGVYMERQTRLNFGRESDPDGKPWAPLKPSTLRRKKTSAILRESGATVGSVAMKGPSGNSVTVSVGTEQAVFHQTGTSKMAQRKIIGISESRHIPKIRKFFESHFAD